MIEFVDLTDKLPSGWEWCMPDQDQWDAGHRYAVTNRSEAEEDDAVKIAGKNPEEILSVVWEVVRRVESTPRDDEPTTRFVSVRDEAKAESGWWTWLRRGALGVLLAYAAAIIVGVTSWLVGLVGR